MLPSPQYAPGSVSLIERDGERDWVAVEEPLEIRVDGEAVAVTMRTPGHDEELALGFLYGEGLIDRPHPVGLSDDLALNTVVVTGPLAGELPARRFYTTSSCGVCGKGAIEQLAVAAKPLPREWGGTPLTRPFLAALPDQLIQPGFDRTGGLHATGLFNARGELRCVREDVGRHNAMDKVIGWALTQGDGADRPDGDGDGDVAYGDARQSPRAPLADHLLCVSGRLSFELVQKALVAGAPVLVGVGAPSSLAVSLAREYGLTLGGFARRGDLNIYSGEERLS